MGAAVVATTGAASDAHVHVGRVNSSLHNGLTKTMRVTDEPALEPN